MRDKFQILDYPVYKDQMQLKNSHAIFEAFNIPMYDSPGFEADDVLGTICQKYKKD